MKTASINVRVEPETARGLTWAVNKYNFEHVDQLTKTDAIELLVSGIIADSDLLMLCSHLASGLSLEEAASTAKGHNYKPLILKSKANADYGKEVNSHGKDN